MATLLHIRSSIFGDTGQSTALANDFIAQWQLRHDKAEIITRDLISDPLPQLDAEVVSALMSSADNRTAKQQSIVDLADRLLAEMRSADQILIGVPMYNFGIPVQMKAWFDLLARSGVTFQYTDQGPVGLLEDKPVVLIATRGGQYRDGGQDFQIPFVKQFLGFVGLKDVQTVYAEGLNMGDVIQSESLSAARAELQS
ncbi:NAD(P)H-dependent oxidoreductase [Marinobacterium sp. MBR-109]|jgi:FMN-dependent NADH-azoreductase|uniref:FMN-dependent NADH-azoreductase n=1 Tax=Marinobacterium sp. MBR-109 TaxID=3156462 RepID=UPI003398F8B1